MLTIRTDESQSGDIDNLMMHYDLGHGSKALLRAAKELPALHRSHLKLTEKHEALIEEYNALKNLISQRDKIDAQIKSHSIKMFT